MLKKLKTIPKIMTFMYFKNRGKNGRKRSKKYKNSKSLRKNSKSLRKMYKKL